MKIILLLTSILWLSSCAHSVHQVHTSDFDLPESVRGKKNIVELGKVIQAKSEQFVIMGFTKETNYINQAYANLVSQCDGTVLGITTQLSTSLGFFSWTNKVLMQGMCVR